MPKLGGAFDAAEFEEHPERYRSIFADEVSRGICQLKVLLEVFTLNRSCTIYLLKQIKIATILVKMHRTQHMMFY